MTDASQSGIATRVGHFLKHEFLEILPATIYFLIGFNLIVFSKHLILLEEGIVYDGMTAATVGALLVAKVVLLTDKVFGGKTASHSRLIWPVLGRTALYTTLVACAHLLEQIIGRMLHSESVASALAAGWVQTPWEHVVFVSSWVFVLFFIYVSHTEVRHAYRLPPVWRVLAARPQAVAAE